MIQWLAQKLSWLLEQTSAQLDDFISWCFIIPLYAIVFLILFELLMVFVKKEMVKRKVIISEVRAFKTNYVLPEGSENDEKKEEKVMKTFLQYNQKTYPDDYYLQLNGIIQKRKPKPFLLILAVAMQSMLSFVFFAHLLLQKNIPESIYYELGAILLSGMLMYGKRLLWLKIPLLLIASYTYLNVFTAEALLFVMIISFFRLTRNIVLHFKSKNTTS